MSLLNQIFDGSVLSSERLMRHRQFYSPVVRQMPAQAAFARWTQRVAVTSELEAARELAGLSDVELRELEAEFMRSPMRQPARWVRQAVFLGTVLIALAALGLSLQALTHLGDTATRTLQAVSIACLLAGLLPVGAGLIAAFSVLDLDLSHGTTGLFVGALDEQHPWLYSAIALTRHEVAEDYRQRTLLERGALRGADFIMMRTLVEAQEALERVRPARALAEQLQRLPAAVPDTLHEPRLVRVGAGPGRESGNDESESAAPRVAAK
jgi:hypothetical protein